MPVVTLTHPEITATLRAAGCVFAEDEASLLLDAAAGDELDAMVARRVAGEPLEVIVGWAEFCGLRIEVDAGVFVPRRRTEVLVGRRARLGRRARGGPGPVLRLRGARRRAGRTCWRSSCYAADIDPAAVGCARRNVATVGGQVFEGDLVEPLPATLRGRVDVLSPTSPTCRPTRSRSCHPRPGCTSRA